MTTLRTRSRLPRAHDPREADVSGQRRLEAVLSAVIAHDERGVVVRDHAGRVVQMNEAARRCLDVDLGDEVQWCASVLPSQLIDADGTIATGRRPDQVARESGEPVPETVFGISEPPRWLAVSASPIETDLGRWVVTLIRDVSEETKMLSRLHRAAATDPLTRVGNRRLLDWLVGSMSDPDEPLVVLVIDLDDFKLVNDHFGHDVGDEVLVAVAERLQNSVRPGDTVVRLGGDEFAVILRDIDDPEGSTIRERVHVALRGAYATSAGVIGVGSSIGTATGTAAEPWALLRRADGEMYDDKRARRERAALDLASISAATLVAT